MKSATLFYASSIFAAFFGIALFTPSVYAKPLDDAGPLSDYLAWQATQPQVEAPQVRYSDATRRAFEIHSAIGSFAFRLAPPQVGLRQLTTSDGMELVLPGSLNIDVTDQDGMIYRTRLADKAARINVYRHGPHYLDIRVLDLTPTSSEGDTLPVLAELVFHVWPKRLYFEARLHAQKDTTITGASVTLSLDKQAVRQAVVGAGETYSSTAFPVAIDELSGSFWLGFVSENSSLAYAVPDPQGTELLQAEVVDNRIEVSQHFDLAQGSRLQPGKPIDLGFRLYTSVGQTSLESAAAEIATEANPLTAENIATGENATYSGYNARAGYYSIGTSRPESLTWLYQHPQTISTASLTIRNDDRPRSLVFRHENTGPGGRLGSGILTDDRGNPLPILVQNSKNFSGENEEPFYDPGDPEYNESYFVLPLRPKEQLVVQSHHTFQNWGKYPIKQVCSLQAWMHYYQMSLGVTETTCHVPFRFGGHQGIWIADLRGISSEMWPLEQQPQFDNVGGHRFFHYIDQHGEHFPRYVGTRFRSTGPNLADWTMDYVTENGEANISIDIMEPPQTDQTRCFMKMRVDFEKPLSVRDGRSQFKLISLDTTTQRLRYGAFGYLDRDDWWKTLHVNEVPLPVTAQLSSKSPLIAFFDCLEEGLKHGNNAILVTDFQGTANGEQISGLTAGLDYFRKKEHIAWIGLDADNLKFEAGDFLELDLVVIPYGSIGDGPEAALLERERYGIDPPRVQVIEGQLADHFPARITLNAQGRAQFELRGGFGILPALVEGFASHLPPQLEEKDAHGKWRVLEMGSAKRGHQVYRTDAGKYGFVFLIDTDGQPRQYRVGY